jgi:hypothetical protein
MLLKTIAAEDSYSNETRTSLAFSCVTAAVSFYSEGFDFSSSHYKTHMTDFDEYILKLFAATVNSRFERSYLVGVSSQKGIWR